MNLKDGRLLWGGLILLFTAILVYCLYIIYGNLGGFDEVKVYRLESIKRTVVGKHYKTRYSDEELEDQFIRCRELIASKRIAGDLVVFNYLNDSLKPNEVEQFIGVMLKEDMAEIPVDFDLVEFESKKRYAVFLSMHPLVRMPEKKLKTMIQDAAAADGNDLQEFYVEIYYADNSMSVEAWVK